MKKDKLPNLISILILTLITAVVWIALSIYRTITTKPAPAVPANISQSLSPTLNQNAVSKIESSIFLSGNQIPQNVATGATTAPSIPTLPPLATPTPSATASATPIATPSSTPLTP